MYLVVGIGNPGAHYARTRHNLGFMVVDALGARRKTQWRTKFGGLCTQCEGLVLLKPHTFMNLSGKSVGEAAHFFKIPIENVLVVHDEVDLPLGTIRVKSGGGEAGHRGLKSISGVFGSQTYLRLRVGVGRPPADFPGSTADFVLEAFPPSEQAAVEALIDRAVAAVELVIEVGVEAAMNEVNRRV